MGTDRLYFEDSTCKRFEATVRERTDAGVILDRTAFYPTGGGQPHDIGVLEAEDESWPVTEVHGRDDIVHVVEGGPPAAGTAVTGRIDWPRRRAHMRYHTAQHLLSAVLLDRFDAPTTGNQLYADRARIDCEHDRFATEDRSAIVERVNELIEADLPVRWYTMSRAEAEAELDPARTRLDLLPESVTTVRIVEIEEIDRTACAGTHVDRTGRIGRFELTGRETAGRGRERLRFRLDD